MTHDPDFKGYIHDVGGPTADFRAPACDKQLTKGVCPGRQCLFPSPCPNLRADHRLLSQPPAQAPEAAGGEEGLHPQRHSL